MLAIHILKPMVILGALEMVQFQVELFMDMGEVHQLGLPQTTEQEVIGRAIHSDKPKVFSIHIKSQIIFFNY